VEPVADLDALAASLRERLLTESAPDGPGDVEGRNRTLVERAAARLDAEAREAPLAAPWSRRPTSTPKTC